MSVNAGNGAAEAASTGDETVGDVPISGEGASETGFQPEDLEAFEGEETLEEEVDPGEEPLTEEAPPPPPPPPSFDMNAFAGVLKDAIAPLAPKPPPPEKMWWDNPKTMAETMLKDPEKFHKGFHEAVDHKVKMALEPVNKAIGQMVQIMQFLSTRSAERPEFNAAQQRAQEITQKYGVPYQAALQMAMDEAGRQGGPAGRQASPAQSGKRVRTIPGHASAPDTSQAGRSKAIPTKGPSDFRGIMDELKAGSKRR